MESYKVPVKDALRPGLGFLNYPEYDMNRKEPNPEEDPRNDHRRIAQNLDVEWCHIDSQLEDAYEEVCDVM